MSDSDLGAAGRGAHRGDRRGDRRAEGQTRRARGGVGDRAEARRPRSGACATSSIRRRRRRQAQDGNSRRTAVHCADAARCDKESVRKQLREKFETLEGRDPEKRMIYPHVDEQVVASVVSDWTGIPVGRMVKDEIENVLRLPEILNGASSANRMACR